MKQEIAYKMHTIHHTIYMHKYRLHNLKYMLHTIKH